MKIGDLVINTEYKTYGIIIDIETIIFYNDTALVYDTDGFCTYYSSFELKILS